MPSSVSVQNLTKMQVVAYCMPLTYAVEAIRDVAIRGAGFLAVWNHLAALVGFAVLGAGLAALSVKRSV